MYVCICNAVSDNAIREAARRGIRSLAELSAETGVATCCGRCSEHAQALLDEAADLSLDVAVCA